MDDTERDITVTAFLGRARDTIAATDAAAEAGDEAGEAPGTATP